MVEYTIDYQKGQIKNKKSGKILGYYNKNGYLTFDDYSNGEKKGKLAHRYIYENYHCCSIMKNIQVNHINGKKNDNRINNLELMTNKQNQQHRGPTILNKTGHKNIEKRDNGNYRFHITVDGINVIDKTFVDIDDAIKYRDKSIEELNKKGNNFISDYKKEEEEEEEDINNIKNIQLIGKSFLLKIIYNKKVFFRKIYKNLEEALTKRNELYKELNELNPNSKFIYREGKSDGKSNIQTETIIKYREKIEELKEMKSQGKNIKSNSTELFKNNTKVCNFIKNKYYYPQEIQDKIIELCGEVGK